MNTIVGTEKLALAIQNVSEETAAHDVNSGGFHQAYHELASRHLVEVDVLKQLKANLNQLEDLQARMRFMMAEVSYLLIKS